ncbi:MAG: hypothetical protein H7836_16880, partial [Magnetococcus sp. YQC-3]
MADGVAVRIPGLNPTSDAKRRDVWGTGWASIGESSVVGHPLSHPLIRPLVGRQMAGGAINCKEEV